MKVICDLVTLISAITSAIFLVLNRFNDWDLPLIETISWVILTLNVFLVLVRSQILREMRDTRNDILRLVGISIPADVSHPIVRKQSQNALSRISDSLSKFQDQSSYEIDNPYVARDVSFELIRTISKGASVWATMDLVARPFLLKNAYTSYLVLQEF